MQALGETTKLISKPLTLSLRLARRNEPPNQILDSNNSAKILVFVYDDGQTKSSSAQLLHDSVSRLLLCGGHNAPDIIAKRFVSILIKQNIENVD